MYRCSTRSVASVRSLLQKLKCRRDGQATCSLHVQAQRCARHGTCSVQPIQQDVTLLEEKEPGSTPVRITLADNPSVIICHHPPNKVQYGLTRPVSRDPETQQQITSEQGEVALELMTENPLVWDIAAVSKLFNVSEESVSLLQIPVSVSDKARISKAVLRTWPESDQSAFRAYQSNTRHETRNKLIAQFPDLFKFCQFNKAEELERIKLYGLTSDIPDSPPQLQGADNTETL